MSRFKLWLNLGLLWRAPELLWLLVMESRSHSHLHRFLFVLRMLSTNNSQPASKGTLTPENSGSSSGTLTAALSTAQAKYTQVNEQSLKAHAMVSLVETRGQFSTQAFFPLRLVRHFTYHFQRIDFHQQLLKSSLTCVFQKGGVKVAS